MDLDWNKLHSGKLTRQEILEHTKDKEWQKLRKQIKGCYLDCRYDLLEEWLETNNNSRAAQVQVTNYINALARGGMIKKVSGEK